MNRIEFNADHVFYEVDENNIITFSIAEGSDADPKKYIIIQCEKGGHNGSWYEVYDISISGYNGFESIILFSTYILIGLSKNIVNDFRINEVRINISDTNFNSVKSCLSSIFESIDPEVITFCIR